MWNLHLEKIKACVLQDLSDEDVSVALFGSMVEGESRRGSDVDVAIIPKGMWNRRKLALLREKLENLNVPYAVELVDFSDVSREFKDFALKKVVWWKN